MSARPLSLGWIDQGELVCAYHGWRYGTDGACTRIPSLPPDRAIPVKARANSFRAEERYGLIWVCLGKPKVDIPEFPPEYYDPTFNWAPFSTDGLWKANAARMLENLADYSHFPFVHPGTLGDPDNPECEPITIEPLEGGFLYDIPQPVNTLRADAGARQTYRLILPFLLIIQRWQPGGNERQTNIFICSPYPKTKQDSSDSWGETSAVIVRMRSCNSGIASPSSRIEPLSNRSGPRNCRST